MASSKINPLNIKILKRDAKLMDGGHKGHFNLVPQESEMKRKLVGDSIRYECQKCSKCCRRNFSIELNIAEMDFLSKKHPELKTAYTYSKGDFVHPFFNTGPKCTMLKNDLCSIYKNRPFECRYYPFHFVEVNSKTEGDYEFGKKYFRLYAYTDCPGLGKGEQWSVRKKDHFISMMLRDYAKHTNMLKITYKVLTTEAFFRKHHQFGDGNIYGTDDEIRQFIEDFKSKEPQEK